MLSALIVDDNATQRGVLSAYLTDWGMTVSTAADGEAALAALRAAAGEGRPFAVVLVDRSMPGMDGVELKNAIVADPALAPGVVLMTGLGQERDAGDAAELVVMLFAVETDPPEDLRPACGSCWAWTRPQDREAIHDVDHRAGDGPKLGRLLLAEDNLINQKVAVAMLTTAGYSVDTVLNGAEAVQAVAGATLRRHLDGLPDARAQRVRGDRRHSGPGGRSPDAPPSSP